MAAEARRSVKRLVTVAGLAAFAFVLLRLQTDASASAMATVLLGFLLLASYMAGTATRGFGLPGVTGYVLLGILVGPFALGILSPPMVELLRRIDEIALALIALTAGGELRMADLRRSVGPILGIGLAVMGVVVVGITGLVLAARPVVPFLSALPWPTVFALGLLLAVWCANSSPDATIAVINESGAAGDFTETVLGTTILKDVLVIVAFSAALSLMAPLVQPDASFDPGLLLQTGWEVGGALLAGGLAGVVFAAVLSRLGTRPVLLTLAFTYLLVLLAEMLHVELLLTAVGAGFVVENYSEEGDRLIHAVEGNALVVFAIFFALAGAALNLRTLAEYWPLALGVVVARTMLTWVGARLGARLGRAAPNVVRWSWMGLISQAGVTLGLSVLVAEALPGPGEVFAAVTTAVIIMHLLAGPVLLKLALERAGETTRADGSGEAVLEDDAGWYPEPGG
ncbi:MAG: cation:proton antiporter [Gemmatimonadota bacterium]